MTHNSESEKEPATTNQNGENLTEQEAQANATEETSADASETNTEASAQPQEDTHAKLEAEVQEAKDKYVRLYADFENFRRRTAKEKIEQIKLANEGLLKDLLPILDDFERALKAFEEAEDKEAIKEGVKLIQDKFGKTLLNKGLKPMESTIGKVFDVEEHESIAQVPAPSDDQKGKVIDEIERGYYLHDKVVRFAKVVVGS
ncbi:nucleotide exchange factor GrpE [Microscilla marina]|uniref:Protein GrpE n=1 Tax=Microscilla marina ATCC 23134 TaxID=313606 RepID=A1ZL21_MICM2|nr:nucleotide exchange factor GrpE [Microscilla marina]EAY28987.1 co-chaperone GrpE [Microscilla marina ATCC 23134]